MTFEYVLNLIIVIVGLVVTLVPYVAAVMTRTKNRYMQGIGKEALKITKALEESGLSGDLKKQAAVSKLNNIFGGNFLTRIMGLNLTPEQFADQVEAAVVTLRTLGIKTPLDTMYTTDTKLDVLVEEKADSDDNIITGFRK